MGQRGFWMVFWIILLLILIGFGFVIYRQDNRPGDGRTAQRATPRTIPGSPSASVMPSGESQAELLVVRAENLEVPWAITRLPDGALLITERPGRVVRIAPDGERSTVSQIEDVARTSEGGLLGITADPDFAQNRYIYLYYTYQSQGESLLNRVVRYRYDNNQLTQPTVIVDAIPGATRHDGGRIAFGPDGYLYIGTGDAIEPSLAQDRQSLAGKVLRVTRDGQPAPGNPFDNSRIYSYGHRNVQGLAWDSQQNLWTTEHGESGKDEINRVEPGKNYGWPTIEGDERQAGMESPIIHSGRNTWAPSGLAIIDDQLYFAGLAGRSLYRYTIGQQSVEPFFSQEYGRLRGVVAGPDKTLFFTTSNRDGRGRPAAHDDRLFQLNLNRL